MLCVPASLLHISALPYTLHLHSVATTYPCMYQYAPLRAPHATMFEAQRGKGAVQFAHAPYTATSTSAITPTKTICTTSSAYDAGVALHIHISQGSRYTCANNIRPPMHMVAAMLWMLHAYKTIHNFHYQLAGLNAENDIFFQIRYVKRFATYTQIWLPRVMQRRVPHCLG